MAKRRRLTSFGYIVILSAVVVLLLIAFAVLKIVSCAVEKSATTDEPISTAEPDTSPEAEVTPEPTEDPGYVITTPDPSAVTPVPVSTATPEPDEPEETSTEYSLTPTEEQIKNALPGRMTNGGVVLRSAPNKSGEILGKYRVGSLLTIYGSGSDDYYFVQMKDDGKCGYMAKKFIVVITATPTPEPTPTPSPSPAPAPEGAVLGSVSRTKVALRTAPDLNDSSNKIGELYQGDAVYVYRQEGDFYYIEVVSTTGKMAVGTKAYAYSTYIKANGTVPVQ